MKAGGAAMWCRSRRFACRDCRHSRWPIAVTFLGEDLRTRERQNGGNSKADAIRPEAKRPGAGNIVGKPMALMLMERDATVCICHAKTRDLAQFTILADILVAAAGKPNLILPQMVRTGAVVIDVGINRMSDRRLVGDVDFAGVAEKASYVPPIHGDVGPMTITMLRENTIASTECLAGLNG